MRSYTTYIAAAAVCLFVICPAMAQQEAQDNIYDYSMYTRDDPGRSSFALNAPVPYQDEQAAQSSGGSGLPPEYDPPERYIRAPLFFDDATPQPTGTLDTRIHMGYKTESKAAALGTDDDFGFLVEGVWGPCNNVEVRLGTPMNIGDGKQNGDGRDGNYDVTVGALYRFWDEGEGWLPAFALSSDVRLPTGYNSAKVDAEFRGILTKTIVGGLRGHLNGFLSTVNGNNYADARSFQWGFVVGMDAPINESWWVVFDYLHRSSENNGRRNMNMVEAGVEWKMNEMQSVHFTTQVGLDGAGDTPNFGAILSYTHALALR